MDLEISLRTLIIDGFCVKFYWASNVMIIPFHPRMLKLVYQLK